MPEITQQKISAAASQIIIWLSLMVGKLAEFNVSDEKVGLQYALSRNIFDLMLRYGGS